jgi:hypothetical protein
MGSRQFAHLREASLKTLRARIPSACPLTVTARPQGGFLVATLDGYDALAGRYQVVAAYLDGYIAAWKRTTRRRATC